MKKAMAVSRFVPGAWNAREKVRSNCSPKNAGCASSTTDADRAGSYASFGTRDTTSWGMYYLLKLRWQLSAGRASMR